MKTLLQLLIAGALLSAALADPPAPPLPVLQVPHAGQTPKMDADPTDPAWPPAPSLPALPLCRDADPQDEPLPTEVRVLWDAEFLYLRFSCQQSAIDSPFTGRDQPHYKADVVEVFLDPAGDGRQYFEIQVSPKNQIYDALFTITAEPRMDEKGILVHEILDRDLWNDVQWDCQTLRTATQILTTAAGRPTGWVADLALPAVPLLRRLGLTRFQPLTLRAHLTRYHWTEPYADPEPSTRRLIAMSWSPIVKGCPHISPGMMGFLKLQP